MPISVPVSILDLAPVRHGETAGDSFAASVALAQLAEAAGFTRIWYAEHHNMPTIASSATSVLIAHVAAHTSSIRLGAGGVMLPNHSPLVIAEQYGTLETLHPGRIDLGLGRAPGSDRPTMHALRRERASSDTFPDDVLELQAYLSDESLVPGVHAHPGEGRRYRSTSSDRRSTAPRWPPRSGCRTPLPHTSRRTRCTRPWPATVAISSHRPSCPSRT